MLGGSLPNLKYIILERLGTKLEEDMMNYGLARS